MQMCMMTLVECFEAFNETVTYGLLGLLTVLQVAPGNLEPW